VLYVEPPHRPQKEKKDLMKTKTYEAMVLLDNALVREDWKKAKATVTDTLTKYGASIVTCRRYDEKKLAYQIKGKNRGTFVLCYFTQEKDTMAEIRREWELNEKVLRSLILRVEEVPATEHELAAAENNADFVVPAPPPDDMVEEEEPIIDPVPLDEIMVPDLNDVDLDSKA
jgi:ribosomal protein S6